MNGCEGRKGVRATLLRKKMCISNCFVNIAVLKEYLSLLKFFLDTLRDEAEPLTPTVRQPNTHTPTTTGAQNAQKKKKFLKNPVAKAEKSMEG